MIGSTHSHWPGNNDIIIVDNALNFNLCIKTSGFHWFPGRFGFDSDHSLCSGSLNNLNLAIAMSARFEELGRMEDLEETIHWHMSPSSTLALRPHGHPHRPDFLSITWGHAVYSRFQQLGKN